MQVSLFNTQYDIAHKWKAGDTERRTFSRLSNPTAQAVEAAMYREDPVVITGKMAEVAPAGWLIHSLISKCGNKPVELMVADERVEESPGGNRHQKPKQSATLSDYTSRLNLGKVRREHVVGLPIKPWCPNGLHGLKFPRFVNDRLQELPPGSHLRDESPRLFMGPGGAGLSLHLSRIPSHFWLVLLVGRARVRIYPRGNLPVLYFNHMRGTFPVRSFEDLTREDLKRHFPLAQVASPWDFVLHPSEMLLVPAGMPFEVSYWEKTVGLSGRFADDKTFAELRAEQHSLAKCNRACRNATGAVFQPPQAEVEDAQRAGGS